MPNFIGTTAMYLVIICQNQCKFGPNTCSLCIADAWHLMKKFDKTLVILVIVVVILPQAQLIFVVIPGGVNFAIF